MDASRLPPELWLRIFRLATLTDKSYKRFQIHYYPFEHRPDEAEQAALNEADAIAASLVLVCRAWRRLALPFLYEIVHLKHGALGLLEALQQSALDNWQGYGHWTRRLELSVIEYEDPSHPVTPLHILQLCPNVEILVKCDDDLLPHYLATADLSRIRRFDWWSPRYRDGDHRFETQDDDHTRGVGLLIDFLSKAHNLQYLSLGQRWNSANFSFDEPSRLVLPSLTILRAENLDPGIRTDLDSWSLPNLKYLVMDSCLVWGLQSRLVQNPSIEVIEMTDDLGFLDGGVLEYVLKVCSNLRELNYYVEYVGPLSFLHNSHCALKTIRLGSQPNPTIRFSAARPASASAIAEVVEHVRAHFATFTRTNFPALERVVLHGEWSEILDSFMNDPSACSALISDGIRLEIADPGVWRTEIRHGVRAMSAGTLYMQQPHHFFRSPFTPNLLY